MFLNYLRDDQRGVVFRLGRPMKVVGPGLVVTIPAVEHVHVVEMGEVLPGWEGYGKEELGQKIISLVLDSPDLDQDTAKKGRGSQIVISGGILLVCAFLTVAGVMAILTGIQDMTGGQAHGRQLLFQFLGGTFLLIIGLGIVWLIFALPKDMQRRIERVQNEHPNAPWMWNKAWVNGRMVQKPKLTVAIIFFTIGIVWITGVYMVFSFKREDILREVDSPVLGIFLLVLFAFIGIILFFVAINGIRSRRYGTTMFVMSSIPGAIGGQLSGTIETGFREIPRHGFLLDLSCSIIGKKGVGTFGDLVWRETKEVPASHLQTGRLGICIPVSFSIPENAPETQDPFTHTTYRTTWHLKVLTDAPDASYEVCFEVPVYKVRGTT